MTDLSNKSREIFKMIRAGERFIVLNHNKPVGILSPVENFEGDLSCWDMQLEKEEEA